MENSDNVFSTQRGETIKLRIRSLLMLAVALIPTACGESQGPVPQPKVPVAESDSKTPRAKTPVTKPIDAVSLKATIAPKEPAGITDARINVGSLDRQAWVLAGDNEPIVRVLPTDAELRRDSRGLVVTKTGHGARYLAFQRGLTGPMIIRLTLDVGAPADERPRAAYRLGFGMRGAEGDNYAIYKRVVVPSQKTSRHVLEIRRDSKQTTFHLNDYVVATFATKEGRVEQFFLELSNPGEVVVTDFQVMVEKAVADQHIIPPVLGRIVGPVPTVFQPGRDVRDETVIRVDGRIDNVYTGGGGRLLLLHDKGRRRLSIVDIQQERIIGEIPVNDEEVLVAAGLDVAAVALKKQKLLQTWDLSTRQLLMSKPLKDQTEVQHLSMGSAAKGPLMVVFTPGSEAPRAGWLDPYRLTAEDVRVPSNSGKIDWPNVKRIWASPDGRTFGIAGARWQVVQFKQNQAEVITDRMGGLYAIPNFDGSYLCTGGQVMDSRFSDNSRSAERFIQKPAESGPYYLRMDQVDYRGLGIKPCTISVHSFDMHEPLLELANIDITTRNDETRTLPTFSPDQRIHFSPHLNRLTTVPRTNDRVVIRRLDVDDLIGESGNPYLYLTTTTLPAAKPGEPYEFLLEAKCHEGNPTFAFVGRPPAGLELSPGGLLTWQAPDIAGPAIETRFQIMVKHNRRQVQRWLTLRVAADQSQADLAGHHAIGLFAGSQAVAKSPSTLKLPAAVRDLTLAGGGRYFVMHLPTQNQLIVLDVADRKIVGEISLKDNDILFASGRDHVLVYFKQRKTLAALQLPTLSPITNRRLPYETVSAMAMPWAGDRPLMLNVSSDSGEYGPVFYEPKTLEPIEVREFRSAGHEIAWDLEPRIRPSADGEWWSVVDDHLNSVRFIDEGFRITSDRVRMKLGAHGVFAVPSPSEPVMFTNDGRRSFAFFSHSAEDFTLPADVNAYYMRIYKWNGHPPPDPSEPCQVNIYLARVDRVVYTVKLDSLTVGDLAASLRTELSPEKRIHFFSERGEIVTLGSSNDKLTWHPVDMGRVHGKASPSYLDFITRDFMLPVAVPGSEIGYQFRAISGSGSAFYERIDGPDGLTISADGRLRWRVPLNLGDDPIHFRVRIRNDTGRTDEARFRLRNPTK